MQNLVALRKAKGLSQLQLAQMLGLSRSTVAMWETSASQPTQGSLVQLAKILDTSTDYLLGLTPHKEVASEHMALHPSFYRFARTAQDLGVSEKDMDAFLDFFRQHQKDNEPR